MAKDRRGGSAPLSVLTTVNDHTTSIAALQTSVTALATNTIQIPASNMEAGSATNPPTRVGGSGGIPAWSFADTVIPILATAIVYPTDWSTFHVDVVWYNNGAGAGDVVWRFDRGGHNAGESTGAELFLGTQVFATAGAQNIVVVSRIATGASVSSKTYRFCRLVRVGNAAADTLANDAAMTRLVLTKAS